RSYGLVVWSKFRDWITMGSRFDGVVRKTTEECVACLGIVLFI
ncbi:hypothetical protein AVEN_273047-1, partial [Araneus ventricosus]